MSLTRGTGSHGTGRPRLHPVSQRRPPLFSPRHITPIALALTGAVPGCYSYVPARLENVPLGSSVRALLSTEAGVSMSARLGYAAGTLSGKLVANSDQGVLLLVRAPGTGLQPGSAALFQRVDVAHPDVLRVDLRVLSKVRTGGLLAALLGAATIALVQAFGASNPGSPPGGGPVPVE